MNNHDLSIFLDAYSSMKSSIRPSKEQFTFINNNAPNFIRGMENLVINDRNQFDRIYQQLLLIGPSGLLDQIRQINESAEAVPYNGGQRRKRSRRQCK